MSEPEIAALRQQIADLSGQVCGLELEFKEIRIGQNQTLNILIEVKTSMEERTKRHDQEIVELKKDVKSLKKSVWTFAGAAAVVSAVVSKLLPKWMS